MKFKHTLQDDQALELNEDMSQPRELYVQKQRVVPVEVHMDFEEALPLFHALPSKVLPPLPIGHQWISHNDTYSVVRDFNALEQDISLTLFGPSQRATPHINFLCQVDGRTTYSLAKILEANGPPDRKYPMTDKQFHVDSYEYIAGETFKNHMRAHLIDHEDTIIRGGLTLSTKFAPNFIPEPPIRAWGMDFRNHKVRALRKVGGYYARFYTYDINFHFKDVHHISWTENLTRPNKNTTYVDYFQTNFSSCLQALPIIQCYEPGVTDRFIRNIRRDSFSTMNDIIEGSVKTRFAAKDQANAIARAANLEITSTNCLPTSAVKLFDLNTTNKADIAIHEMQRSLHHVSKLQEIDDATIYSARTQAKGIRFFEQLDNAEGVEIDVESLKDSFIQKFSL